ncbi:hypothetical protein DJ82_00150 [Halorubrum sp. Ib24]|uniref:hypothetical protein n=1 Tax=unclassified Halorubrum TaxID=2642239 RepID=UPI000B98ED65|nr:MULTISPECIES: hypothetical protein [unclassified Halorubrum]OYR41204.1 hypothetical protein DJ75_14285 [Halorubrum sp. Eb13]OYR43356.1 hypothetical protein DJ82_00150 [Halorubrum sp. Ib24]OYR52238.1 hypothetical protein DJ74_01990 [Halorubrum sp. Ea8]
MWQRILSDALLAVFGSPPWFEEGLMDGMLSGGLFIAGLVLFTAGYVAYRDVDSGLKLPERTDVSLIGLAGLAPAVLVGLTKLVGSLTGVPYNSLTMTSYAADVSVIPVLLLAGLGIGVGVPTLVIVSQVLVQGSFKQVAGGNTAIVLTTLITGFVMMGNTGGLATVPDLGKLVGAVLFAISVGAGVFAVEYVSSERLHYVAYAPVLLVAAVISLSGIAEIGSIAGGLFVATHLAVLGIAAYTYERTNSLLAPALAYTSLSLANTTVVLLYEAGMQSW